VHREHTDVKQLARTPARQVMPRSEVHQPASSSNKHTSEMPKANLARQSTERHDASSVWDTTITPLPSRQNSSSSVANSFDTAPSVQSNANHAAAIPPVTSPTAKNPPEVDINPKVEAPERSRTASRRSGSRKKCIGTQCRSIGVSDYATTSIEVVGTAATTAAATECCYVGATTTERYYASITGKDSSTTRISRRRKW